MILALFGTNPYPFTRLLSALEQVAESTNERVVAQTGNTPVSASKVECHPFVPHDQIRDWLAEADVAVTQGGFGSIRDCLRAEVPVIAVPRQPELGECQDRQTEVVEALAAESLIYPLHEIGELPALIEAARSAPKRAPIESEIPALVADAVDRFMEP